MIDEKKSEWLRTLCEPHSVETGWREWTKHPFSISLNGVAYACATDGKAFGMVADFSDFAVLAADSLKSVLGVVNQGTVALGETALDRLRAWCDVEAPSSPCDSCNGGGWCTCPCGAEEHDCSTCDGDGLVLENEVPGVLAGIRVNRLILKRLVVGLDGDRVAVRTSEDRGVLVIESGAVRGILAALREVKGKDDGPVYDLADPPAVSP